MPALIQADTEPEEVWIQLTDNPHPDNDYDLQEVVLTGRAWEEAGYTVEAFEKNEVWWMHVIKKR